MGSRSRRLLNPFQRRELDGLERAPWSTSVDHLGLVETVDRFGESIVVAVADATDGGLDAGLRQALGVSNADVLGGFKRSSQHLNEGGCVEPWKAPITPFWTGAAAVTGTAASRKAI